MKKVDTKIDVNFTSCNYLADIPTYVKIKRGRSMALTTPQGFHV